MKPTTQTTQTSKTHVVVERERERVTFKQLFSLPFSKTQFFTSSVFKLQTSNFQLYKLSTLCLLLIAYCPLSFSQNIGINSTGATPKASAILDVDAPNKGLLIPRVALTDTADVTTIAAPDTSLVVYNTNATMAGGNNVGFYYWSGSKWIVMPAPANGPGTAGQVLTSQGAATEPAWSTLSVSSSGGGPTGCADCITQTAIVGTIVNWDNCRNSCIAMGAGWRLPTFDEETFIISGGLGTPTGGFISNWVWTSTPWDARVAEAPDTGNWVVLFESTGNWTPVNVSAPHCRCVR